MTGFDKFPFDFSHIASGTRFSRTRYTRGWWDGERLRIFAEVKGKPKVIYDQPVAGFTAHDPQRTRWQDPVSGREFSLIKSTGCGCNYKKLSINPIKAPDPSVLV